MSTNYLTWRHSSECDDSGGDSYVEVAFLGDQVIARDSADLDSAPLMFGRDAWAAFVHGVKAGEFDT